MSEKRAKEARKQAEEKSNKPLFTIVIYAMGDGRVLVKGFPVDWQKAKGILNAAIDNVHLHFLLKAKEGKLDDALVISDSRIIVPKNKLLVPNPGRN